MSTDTPDVPDDPKLPGDGGTVPTAVLDELLAEPVCREVVRELASATDPVPVSRLAERVVADREGIEPEHVSRDRKRRLRERIQSEPLPRLTGWGIVEFDARLARASLGSAADELLDRWDDRADELPAPP